MRGKNFAFVVSHLTKISIIVVVAKVYFRLNL